MKHVLGISSHGKPIGGARRRGPLAWYLRLIGGLLVGCAAWLEYAPSLLAVDTGGRVSGFQKTAQWQWPDPAVYQELMLSYMEQRQTPEATRRQVAQRWETASGPLRGPLLLDLLLDCGAILDERVRAVVQLLRDPQQEAMRPHELPWLNSELPGWLQDAMRLAMARALGQRQMYDEALEALRGLEPQGVCDPATLLFYRAVSEHHLLMKQPCAEDLDLLLQRETELPMRYARMARMLRADLEAYEPDSLDEVARLMRDVQRRLDLGRAGKLVRDEEQKIVDKLDKLIEQLEQQLQQQQQQQQQSQSNGSSQQAQSQPMEDSQIAGGSGPGDVDNKDSGNRAGWGNLPPAERQQALQRLTEQLPSHYREVIEGYFRELAKRQP
ncbi:MAG: hypothetical protein KatS3mg111_3974 [Pirellulaceae bacterium]|nr:MAG: hypothetical protein KatS3mg111_3974 [Pirellulaceae bacterium]